jgi:vancomycin resistance protein YoaR
MSRHYPKSRVPTGRYHKGAIAGWVIGAIVVLAGAYVAAQWFLADRVPAGTTIAGIDLGGKSRLDAVSKVEQTLGAKSRQPIALSAGGRQTALDPVTSGVTLNSAETVDQLVEFSLHPSRLLSHIRGNYGEAPLAININQSRFVPAAERVAQALAQEPVDGTVFFVDGGAASTPARDGQQVTVSEIEAYIRANWLEIDATHVLQTEAITPTITQAATDTALSIAKQIASGPIAVEVDAQNFSMPATKVMDATTFRARGGELVPEFNGAVLRHELLAGIPNLLRDPVDARFVFQDGLPIVVPGQNGTELDETAVATAIEQAAISGTRTAQIQLIEEAPELTAEYLESLGVNEVVSSFSTALTNDSVRTGNIRRGAELITGVLIRPGEVFSLLDNITPIDALNGFGNAGIILQGQFTQGMGGGLSQLATTTYNAGFFAGFEDVESRPHTLFISRYPAGREATIVNPGQDLKFRNNTPYGAVMQGWIQGGRVHVAVWSSPHFKVETTASERQNITQPIVEERSGPNCMYQSVGPAGFRITNTRRVYLVSNGELAFEDSKSWTYRPTNGIRCIG